MRALLRPGSVMMNTMKQTQALDVMKLGHNVFLTGEPGSGKTYALNRFIEYCRDSGIGLGITASTGIAATHIGGMTIHSWSGIGVHTDLGTEQLKNLRKNGRLMSRLKKTRVLIIDEISMLDGARFELINRICKTLKDSDKPFGGLQVVLCGDLFQLPPVTRGADEIDFVHTSPAWEELGLKVCYLSEQYRQEADEGLLDVLRQIRGGHVTPETHGLLAQRTRAERDHGKVTRLYTHNMDVDSLNKRQLDELKSEYRYFTMHASGQEHFIEQLKKSCLAPETLELKTGAQVLCVANNPPAGYMNGSRGEVVGFENDRPIIRLESGREVKLERFTWSISDGERTLAEISQFPLRLAWAITVHKSQGMNLDAAEIDLTRAFTPGMGYVALSRLRHIGGLFLRGLNETALEVSPEISLFDAYLQHQSRKVISQLEQMQQSELENLHSRIRTNLSSDYAEYDKELFEKLRTWRSERAHAEGVPAYRVFDDKTVIALAAERPDTKTALPAVPGIGPKKLEQYGDDILHIINQHSGKLF